MVNHDGPIPAQRPSPDAEPPADGLTPEAAEVLQLFGLIGSNPASGDRSVQISNAPGHRMVSRSDRPVDTFLDGQRVTQRTVAVGYQGTQIAAVVVDDHTPYAPRSWQRTECDATGPDGTVGSFIEAFCGLNPTKQEVILEGLRFLTSKLRRLGAIATSE